MQEEVKFLVTITLELEEEGVDTEEAIQVLEETLEEIPLQDEHLPPGVSFDSMRIQLK